MNVDLLKDNPDWRWYILFGGAFVVLTIAGWLFLRYNPVRIGFLTGDFFFISYTDKQHRSNHGQRAMRAVYVKLLTGRI
jgi:hypothetical protein